MQIAIHPLLRLMYLEMSIATCSKCIEMSQQRDEKESQPYQIQLLVKL